MNNATKSKLNAVEKALSSKPMIPRTICKFKDGSVSQIIGMNVLQQFLDGEISAVCCDDPDIAHLLRALDTEKTVKIELITLVPGCKFRRTEV